MRRVCVVGVTGAGKTTVAARLAGLLGVAHVELDALNWHDGWRDTHRTVRFRELVDAATAGDGWVVDGNYGAVRDLVWPRADTVVWLDPGFPTAVARLWVRTARRSLRRDRLWGTDNRESMTRALFSRDSILWWQVRTFRTHRRRYPSLFLEPAHRHLAVHRLRTREEVEAFLAAVGRP